MYLHAFLENLLLIALAAPAGAGVLALMTLPVQGWRLAARGWWYMTLLFLGLGALATVPTLLTGVTYALLDRECAGALFGYSCY